ncbi:DUF1176 domain-containing protein [Celeribacter sp. SCSIO 80788]|uniref:DUF1176 domain-containing protein n=1 Tax=Celeribacter sp. SCSIO 80788 TaxID=3117013 RepID=UPI003DA2D9A9
MRFRDPASAFVCALLTTGAVLPGSARADEIARFHHKQWQAECGPDYCTLLPRAYPWLALMRSNRGGPWVLSVEGGMVLEMAPENGHLEIDDRRVDWPQEVEFPFPQALLDGAVIEFAPEEEGFSEGTSLAGIKAGVLWVEEQQGGVPPARMLTWRQPDWAALEVRAREITTEMCEDWEMSSYDDPAGIKHVEGHPEIRVLAQSCWTAAYNVGSNVYLLGPLLDGVEPVRAAGRHLGEDHYEFGLWELLDYADGFESHYKGRGIGDCFSTDRWRFDGFVYRLELGIVDDDCDTKIIPRVVWPE